jgi:hypothetical protein
METWRIFSFNLKCNAANLPIFVPTKSYGFLQSEDNLCLNVHKISTLKTEFINIIKKYMISVTYDRCRVPFQYSNQMHMINDVQECTEWKSLN